MKLKTLILSLAFAAIASSAWAVDTLAPGSEPPRHEPVGHLSIKDSAPAFSSPDVNMAPNGDRVSHYPPYYRPEQSGHGR